MSVPDHVLRADADMRGSWYKNLVFEHPRMVAVRDQVLAALRPTSSCRLIAVCGPTGVGKTTLMECIAPALRERFAPLSGVEVAPGVMPVVKMECPSSRERGYDFNREHWKSLLEAMGDLFLDRHFDPDAAAKRRRAGSERPAIGRKSTGADLRSAAESFMKLRATQVLLLDEAHHMVRVRGTRVVEEHMDEIKSFGSRTGVRQVLFGTELLKDLLRGNGQLTRRTLEVFYDAYAYDRASDREAFNEILGHLYLHLPLRELESREDEFDYFFLHSAGCVGVLKNWLVDALDRALAAGRENLSADDLESTALGRDRLDVIADGVLQFREFARPSAPLSEISEKLGMSSATGSPRKPPARPRRSRPGLRNPHRDPVPREPT